MEPFRPCCVCVVLAPSAGELLRKHSHHWACVHLTTTTTTNTAAAAIIINIMVAQAGAFHWRGRIVSLGCKLAAFLHGQLSR